MPRKNLGSGSAASASTETTIYQPAASNISGTVGKLSFFNTSSSAQVVVTVYGAHIGAAGSDDVIDEAVINPRKSFICRAAINEVISGSNLLSFETDTGSNVVNYSCSGSEES